MKGWRTIAMNLALAIAPVAVDHLSRVDWTQYLSPTSAVIAVTVINLAMRFITTTPVGVK